MYFLYFLYLLLMYVCLLLGYFLIIQEVLPVAGVEMQLTAAVSLLTILQEESISIHTYSHSFLQLILQNLEHRDAGQTNVMLLIS